MRPGTAADKLRVEHGRTGSKDCVETRTEGGKRAQTANGLPYSDILLVGSDLVRLEQVAMEPRE